MMKNIKILTTLLLATWLLPLAMSAAEESAITGPDEATWASFLARHDMVWDTFVKRRNNPLKVHARPFLGNGFCGASITTDGAGVRFRVDRQDAYGPKMNASHIKTWNRADGDPDKRQALLRHWTRTAEGSELPERPPAENGMNRRFRFGYFTLAGAVPVDAATARVRLWDATVETTMQIGADAITIQAFACADPDVLVFHCIGPVDDWQLKFHPLLLVPQLEEPLIKRTRSDDGIATVALPYHWQGCRSVAWSDEKSGTGERVIIVGLASGRDGEGADAAADRVRAARKLGAAALLSRRQAQYREALTRHFLSFSDTRLEGLYWINMYRLLSQYHPEGPMADLQGQWTDDFIAYKAVCNDLNTQGAYACLAANQLSDYAVTLLRTIDENIENLHKNAGSPASEPNLIALQRGSDDRLYGWMLKGRPDPTAQRRHIDEVDHAFLTCAPLDPDYRVAPESVACLTWLLHPYYRAYRMTMDEQLARRLFTLLKMSMRGHWYLVEGKKSDDGLYHMPHTASPELYAGRHTPVDAPYNLAAAKWCARTLVELNDRWGFEDPERDRWQDIHDHLAPWPNEDGVFRDWVGAQPHGSYRHFSHLIMAWPYRVLDFEKPTEVAMLKNSLDAWTDAGVHHEWSLTVQAAMYATIGEADAWLASFTKGMGTHCTEGGILIETPHLRQAALAEAFLQSYNGIISVFPAVPTDWQDAAFRTMRAEGAFDVSAKRSNGATQWIAIHSDAGEPCRVQTDLARPIEAVGARALSLQDENGILSIDLKKGESVLLKTKGTTIDTSIAPVSDDGMTNWWPEQRKRP